MLQEHLKPTWSWHPNHTLEPLPKVSPQQLLIWLPLKIHCWYVNNGLQGWLPWSCLHNCRSLPRIWWHLDNSLGFVCFDCLMGRTFHLPVTLQKTQSVTVIPEILGYFQNYNEVKKMSPDPLHSGGVWAQDYQPTALPTPTISCLSNIAPPPHLPPPINPFSS